MSKKVKKLFCVTFVVIVLFIFIDVFRFPECYINTWRYQLKNDIYDNNQSAIELYENVYVKNHRDLFNDNFEIRNTYINEVENVK